MKILVTGGTNGMGKGVARISSGIDSQAHEVIIMCRSEKLGIATVRELESSGKNNKISMILCDLTKLSDVRNAINEIQSKHESLDGIFINAGLGYAPKRVITENGMDSHFQVNYLSHFMLTLNLLNLLEKSDKGGRVIFNVTNTGKIFWNDMQMDRNWSFENGVFQAMAAKRMFLHKLHNIYQKIPGKEISFIGFEISKTVWSNQVNIIPVFMKTMASVMKLLGRFISIEECGIIMTPLFIEKKEESIKKSGKLITWKKGNFTEIIEDETILNRELQDRLWASSIKLCNDVKTTEISEKLHNYYLTERFQ